MRLHAIERDGSVDLGGAQGCDALAGVIEMTVALYERRGFVRPWIGYVAVDSGQAIGTCGFAGPPSDDEAEIAYFTFPGHEGKGVATTMAAALVGLCTDAARKRGANFIAHTLPTDGPSTTILRKLGFSLLGVIHHPQDGAVWKWKRGEIAA
jgi:ribosomal-protein-alanine N-acetyltransferase